MTNFHTISDRVFRTMNEQAIALQEELAGVKAQLESTEKSYDRALQETIELQDRVKAFRLGRQFGMSPDFARKWLQDRQANGVQRDLMVGWDRAAKNADHTVVVPVLPTNPEADDIADELFADAYRESHTAIGRAKAQAERELGDVPSKTAGQRAQERASIQMQPLRDHFEKLTNPELVGVAAHDVEAGEDLAVIIDDPFAPHKEPTIPEALQWYETFGPDVEDPQYSVQSLPKVVSGLRRINTDLNRRRNEAQGDRAKMKDTLVRTQNACRRHKTRIARMKPQLEALQEVANAAFPLFLALTEATALVDPIGAQAGSGAVVQLDYSAKLQQLCIDFHNKFNEAAEVLTPPTIVRVDGLEIKYT